VKTVQNKVAPEASTTANVLRRLYCRPPRKYGKTPFWIFTDMFILWICACLKIRHGATQKWFAFRAGFCQQRRVEQLKLAGCHSGVILSRQVAKSDTEILNSMQHHIKLLVVLRS
jgi:hypothetical protein